MKGEEKGEGKGRESRGGKEGEVCLPQLGSLDPAVEEGGKGRRARSGAWVGASRHFFFFFTSFFHFKHWSKSSHICIVAADILCWLFQKRTISRCSCSTCKLAESIYRLSVRYSAVTFLKM